MDDLISSEIPNSSDCISREAAIDALYNVDEYNGRSIKAIKNLPSAQPQPEEDCDTCKHGYFGDRQCDNCRVRYPSHYEREEEQHE